MGTRNLTMVINKEGETKIAQYGQWDGYPSGVGIGVLKFLRNEDALSKLQANFSKVRFLSDSQADKDFMEAYNKNAPEWSSDPDNRTAEQKRWFDLYITRNLACDILDNIANSTDDDILIIDQQGTAKGDDSWVEWCYVINLQTQTLDVYNRLDSPIIKSYPLNALPSNEDFINELEGSDEDNDDN